MSAGCREVFLTFDVEGPPLREDYMDDRALMALHNTLMLLDKYNFKAMFFVTGSVLSKIERSAEVVEMMRKHEIGYHSSSHSSRPMIFEYTDVKSYDEAIQTSLVRETSRIDLSTGTPHGEGGIYTLKNTFYDKKIVSFRAPFLCWSPPHIEALSELGIGFDFSASVCNSPTFHKGITFYPYPIAVDAITSSIGYFNTVPKMHLFPAFLLTEILKTPCSILLMHPTRQVYPAKNKVNSNTEPDFRQLISEPRNWASVALRGAFVEMLLSGLTFLQNMGAIKIMPPLIEGGGLDAEKVNSEWICRVSMYGPQRLFGYKGRFLLSHFRRFFESPITH